jgi:hypothetical protein
VLVEVKADNMYALLKSLKEYDKAINSYAFGASAHVSFKNKIPDDFEKFLQQKGLSNISIAAADITIEDCFIKLLKN